jgi:tRNA-specific 2-thiouridylase
MSGGVDSSVAAALLQGQGCRVTGITMQVSDGGTYALDEAAAAAGHLGIEHHTVDLRDVFQSEIIDYFCSEYSRGRTPNPCVRCNRLIKFGALWEAARRLGADCLATGHYARVATDPATGRPQLRRGVDRRKDQSYFLHALDRPQLRRARMPLGDYTKAQVRRMAADMHLPAAVRPESQDICFLHGEDYTALVTNRLPGAARPGPIEDAHGREIGRHRGLAFYTIGQRRGLGIAAPEPLYVVGIDPARNVLVAGPSRLLYRDRLQAHGFNWIAPDGLAGPQRVLAQIRYQHRAAPARAVPLAEGLVEVVFEKPQLAITPGQAVVLYDLGGETVLGGGTIR